MTREAPGWTTLLGIGGVMAASFAAGALIGWWLAVSNRIAAVRWLRGDVSQIVILDTLGKVQSIVSSGHSVEATPSWLPDDSGILYSSDLPHAHRVFDAIALFRARKDVPEGTKAKILANGARFFEEGSR